MSEEFWIQRALAASEDTLFEDVARYTIGTAYAQDVVSAGDVEAEVTLGVVNADDLRLLGKKVFSRISHEAYDLICSNKNGERDDLMQSLNVSDLAAVTYLVSIGTGHLGMSAPLAAAASTILLKMVIKPGVEGLCDYWKTML